MKKNRRINPDTIVLLKQVGKGFCALALVALVIWSIWHGTRLDAVTLTKIEVSGGETIRHDLVETLAQAELEGTYLGLIPKTFSFFYPKTNIEEAVSQLERVYDVVVSRTNHQTLRVEFSEYSPYALWCGEATDAQCVFIDDTGYAFGRAPDLRGGALLRFVSPGRSPSTDELFVDQASFDHLQDLVLQLDNFGWFPNQIIYDQVGDISVFLPGGSELKVPSEEAPALIMDNLQTVLATEEFNELTPGNFAYIDLRFGNKVYVNVDGVPEEEETELELATSTEAEVEVTE